jgi:peptidyl-prolyl cis-trans isomerase A (cyclophilin A)
MKSKLLLLCAAFCFLFSQATSAQTPPPAKKQLSKSAAAGKKAAALPFDRALLRPALLKEKAPELFDVKFSTTRGEFTVRVTRAWAPLGADRFYNLVKNHFYDGAVFFRVVDGFVAQLGISPYPQVSAAWKKAVIKDDPVKESNLPGTVTFATDGPDTRTTQIFISLKNNSHLDRKGFSPFGKVTEGTMAVVKLYGGYGDSPDRGGDGPEQDKMEKRGNAYLEKGPRGGHGGKGWPKLDRITSATIVLPSVAPAKK